MRQTFKLYYFVIRRLPHLLNAQYSEEDLGWEIIKLSTVDVWLHNCKKMNCFQVFITVLLSLLHLILILGLRFSLVSWMLNYGNLCKQAELSTKWSKQHLCCIVPQCLLCPILHDGSVLARWSSAVVSNLYCQRPKLAN